MTRRGTGSERPEKTLSLHASLILNRDVAYDSQNSKTNK